MDICGMLSKKFSASDFFSTIQSRSVFFDALARHICKPGLECPPISIDAQCRLCLDYYIALHMMADRGFSITKCKPPVFQVTFHVRAIHPTDLRADGHR